MHNLVSLLGIVVLLGLAWLLSNNRRLFPWRVVGWGLGLQMVLAVLLLKTPWGKAFFAGARDFVTRLLSFTDAGASLLWGNLYRTGEDVVAFTNPEAGYWQVTNSATGELQTLGTVFVIHILPTIIFFSSLMALLYHLGVMQKLIARHGLGHAQDHGHQRQRNPELPRPTCSWARPRPPSSSSPT
jgi:CNT family concentrative nucleoside transporter